MARTNEITPYHTSKMSDVYLLIYSLLVYCPLCVDLGGKDKYTYPIVRRGGWVEI